MKKMLMFLVALAIVAVPFVSFAACDAVIVESNANGTTVKVPASIPEEFGGDTVEIYAEDVTYNGHMSATISADGKFYEVTNKMVDLQAAGRDTLQVSVKLAKYSHWPEVDKQQGDDSSIPDECVVPGSKKGWDYLATRKK
ncbi:MAG: hypothetical protein PF572_04640 [Patescibacteria group bacterium]|jgi:hypothetical protein|nr:hypothetical protein [Patescibacteria group bacterium]